MRDKCSVKIIDVNERFGTGIVFNFGKFVDRVGTYRKDLIFKFNDIFEKILDNNPDFFDRLYDVECLIDDSFDYVVDRSIDKVSGGSGVVFEQFHTEKKKDNLSYKLEPMGYYDDSLDDDDIFEFKEFKLEDYDTDDYKVIRRSR